MDITKDCGIYKITNKITNKFYIGSSNNIKRRWDEHIRELNRNVHHNSYLQNAWNKYGEENFVFEIIELCNNDTQIEREQYWLDKTMCYDKNIGYNLSKIASKVILSDNAILDRRNKKISQTQIGENNSCAKYTEDKIKNVIKDLMNPNLSWNEIMLNNNVEKSVISAIITRHNWSYLTEGINFPKRNTVCKLTEDDVKEIIPLILSGKTDDEISEAYIVTKQAISNIRKYKTWKHLTNNIDFSSINESKPKGGIGLRLPIQTVKNIRLDIQNGLKNKDIAKKYDVNISVVSSIKTGRSYKNIA